MAFPQGLGTFAPLARRLPPTAARLNAYHQHHHIRRLLSRAAVPSASNTALVGPRGCLLLLPRSLRSPPPSIASSFFLPSRSPSRALLSSSAADPATSDSATYSIWFDNVFPIKLLRWDPRHYFVKRYADSLKSVAKQTLIPPTTTFPPTATFTYVGSVSSIKEGGLLMRFKYEGGDVEEAYDVIRKHVDGGSLRSSFNFGAIRAFVVNGKPFIEDLGSSIASSRIRVECTGGAPLSVQELYNEFREFGKIEDITIQPETKDSPRYGHIQFWKVRSATSARICMHGKKVGTTMLSVSYEPALKRGSIWKYIQDHPRISIPVILAIVAFISFIVFDPLRVFFVTSQITERFSLHKYGSIVSSWLSSVREYIMGGAVISKPKKDDADGSGLLAERKEQIKKLKVFLKETPDTVFLVTGPKGSGKSEVVDHASKGEPYKLVINCDDFINKPDLQMLNAFAKQVGYFPVLGWSGAVGALVDTLTASLTGTKAGFASTTDQSVRRMLEVMTLAMNRITTSQRAAQQKLLEAQRARLAADPTASVDPLPDVEFPVVVVEGYWTRENARQQYVYDLLTEWAALLAENHIAQVVFVSNNPGAIKHIGRAMPTKTIETIALTDSAPDAALAYVRRGLGLSPDDTPPALVTAIDALGGRLTDLDLLIQKTRASATKDPKFASSSSLPAKFGSDLSSALERSLSEIVLRTVTEIRKVGLFEDGGSVTASSSSGGGSDKKKEWSAAQMWKLVQLLSKNEELSYDEVRWHPVFKGEETALQAIERAGLISIGLNNGRPYTIRAGRPVYRSAFRHLLTDTRYAALQTLLLLKHLTAAEESKLAALEGELSVLTSLSSARSRLRMSGAARREVEKRVEFLASKIGEGQDKVRGWAEEETKLKALVKLKE
ncbi:RNA12 protein-domain-containing protein [Zopfochytrium polystomum]|nr:RNA12 protein-domain-containing protein [Zopfochytrium polystomum]